MDNPSVKIKPVENKPSRRDVLRMGCIGALVLAAGGAGVLSQTDMIDRVRGVTNTPLLDDPAAWTYANNELRLSLGQVAALNQPGSAVRLESDQLPEDLLVVYGVDSEYYVYVNKCTHGQRKIDLDDNGQLRCVSVNRSSFDYGGSVLSGPAAGTLTTYTVAQQDGQLVITLS
jgi:nitrite reductase/ring-hydroxylating ferredoxin subunit